MNGSMLVLAQVIKRTPHTTYHKARGKSVNLILATIAVYQDTKIGTVVTVRFTRSWQLTTLLGNHTAAVPTLRHSLHRTYTRSLGRGAA